MSKQNSLCGSDATIGQLYPDLCRIMLFVAFEQSDPESEANYQQIIFTPESGADLRLDCSRPACTCGGFDFAPLVDSMVRNGESRSHGDLYCSGHLAPGDECCSLHAEYRIIID